MIEFIAGCFVGFAVIGINAVAANVFSKMKVKANKHAVIREFCSKENYCIYGCGGGYKHDDNQYYGGFNCQSDHK